MLPNGRVLALDLSTKTGWCIGTPAGIERCGVWELKVSQFDDRGRIARRLAAKLRTEFMAWPIDLIAREQAMAPGAQIHGMENSANTLAETWLEIGALEAAAYYWKVRIKDVPVTAHRKLVTGQSRWDNRKEAKRQCIAAVKRLGLWPPGRKDDDNLADAIAIFVHTIATEYGRHIGKFNLESTR